MRESTPPAGRVRYLALGDSYTIGESVSPREAFPFQLGARLADRLQLDGPEVIARTGWTTDELLHVLQESSPHGPYDLVTLLVGVNNQYRGRDVDSYRVEFKKLLNQAIDYAGNRPARVIVLSIPDWGMTPFGREHENVSAEIDAFNAVNRVETLVAGVRYVDITPISRAAARDLTLIAGDGLHPSAGMYARWVDLLAPVAERALEGG